MNEPIHLSTCPRCGHINAPGYIGLLRVCTCALEQPHKAAKLTILTPTYRRPIGLRMCRASVEGQHRADEIQHLIIADNVGKGVAGMYADLPNYNADITGEWVYVLSDDDVLVYPRIVDLIEHVEASAPAAQCIMVKMFCNGRVLPWPQCWEAQPLMGGVTLSNWIVKKEVHAAHPFGCRYEGDLDQIASIYMAGVPTAWCDLVVSASQAGANFGRPE